MENPLPVTETEFTVRVAAPVEDNVSVSVAGVLTLALPKLRFDALRLSDAAVAFDCELEILVSCPPHPDKSANMQATRTCAIAFRQRVRRGLLLLLSLSLQKA